MAARSNRTFPGMIEFHGISSPEVRIWRQHGRRQWRCKTLVDSGLGASDGV